MNSIPNELSSRFSDIEVRRQIIQKYGDSPNMFVGENADGEKVALFISRKNGIVLNTYQDNGWLRVDYYDAEGYFEGETFDGRWAETDEARPNPRPYDPLGIMDKPKKFTIDDYKVELEKAHQQTCSGEKIDKIMRSFRIRLHQDLRVGDGVTVNLWSDSHAGTIIRRTRCSLWIQRDAAFRTDKNGMSDCQDYRYERDPHGTVYQARWSEKWGCFIYGGHKDGKPISVGRHEYYDYSF